jgi:hypothetical protein
MQISYQFIAGFLFSFVWNFSRSHIQASNRWKNERIWLKMLWLLSLFTSSVSLTGNCKLNTTKIFEYSRKPLKGIKHLIFYDLFIGLFRKIFKSEFCDHFPIIIMVCLKYGVTFSWGPVIPQNLQSSIAIDRVFQLI